MSRVQIPHFNGADHDHRERIHRRRRPHARGIGAALDAARGASDVDLDWGLNDGILEIECEDGSKLIVNRHVPNREIWVAARSGGFHFRPRDGLWRDTRSGDELGAALAALVRRKRGSRWPCRRSPRRHLS